MVTRGGATGGYRGLEPPSGKLGICRRAGVTGVPRKSHHFIACAVILISSMFHFLGVGDSRCY